MEDGIEEKSSLFQRVLNSPFLHPTALVLGAIIALSESIYPVSYTHLPLPTILLV